MKRHFLLLLFVIFSISTCCAQEASSELKEKFFSICSNTRSGILKDLRTDTNVYVRLTRLIGQCDSILSVTPGQKDALVEKAIWENYLAVYLAHYTATFADKVEEITPGTPLDSNDITTWDGHYFNQQIIRHFEASLDDTDFLQSVDILQYKDFLNNDYNYQYLPTLYNFLAYNYAFCLQNFRPWTWHPFSFSDTNYFTTSEQFVTYEIPCIDAEAPEYKFMRLCQNLERANRDGGYFDAMIFWNMERVLFIKKKNSDAHSNDLLINCLEKITVQYPHSVAYKGICAQLADAYLKSNRQDAFDIGRKYLEVSGLYYQIRGNGQTWAEWFEEPSVSADFVEGNNCVMLSRIVSRQTDSLYAYFILPEKERKRDKINHHELLRIQRREIVYDTLIYISHGSDYGYDTTIVLFPPLPEESYLFILRDNPLLEPGEDEHIYLKDSVKTRGWWKVENSKTLLVQADNRVTLICVDGRDGSPLPHQIHSLFRENDYFWPTYVRSFMSKKDGRASAKISPFKDFQVDDWENTIYIYNGYGERRWRFASAINTDRKIYRPGQTVNFKVTIEKNNSKNQVKGFYKNRKVNVSFYQGNNNIYKKTLKTNKFGSIADSCALPENVEPGEVIINVAKNHKGIKIRNWRYYYRYRGYYDRKHRRRFMGGCALQIEEYKRPQFEITLEKPEGSYALGDSIPVRGRVKAYAGYSLAESKVEYSVFGWDFVAKTGTATTDADGNFEFWFHTPEISKLNNLRFDVIASATDVTGETQEAQIHFDVEMLPYKLNVEIPSIYFEEEFPTREVILSAVNSAVKLQNVTAHYTIEKIIQPQRFFHTAPFFCARTTEQLGEKFSLWAFNNENLPVNWPRESVVAEGDVEIAGNGWFTLPKLPSGAYRLFVKSQSSNNKEVVNEKYFFVGHLGDTLSPAYEGVWAWVDKTAAAAGDTLHFHVGTAIPNATIFVDLFNSEKSVESFNIVNKQHFAFDYVVKKDDTIRLQLVTNCVHLGEHFTASTETQLRELPKVTYEWETFRCDLLPGEQTTFRLRITNSDGTPADAEVLCYMYDASLDVFASNTISNLRPHYRPDKVTTERVPYKFKYIHDHKVLISPNSPTDSKFALVPQWKCAPSRYSYSDYSRFGISSPLLNSRHSAPCHSQIMTVRGNRSDGQRTIIDGVVVRSNNDHVSEPLASSAGVSSLDGQMTRVSKNRSQSEDAFESVDEKFSPRTNFAETAFFYPFLRTDENGVVEVKFTIPESLTRWKIQGLAHTLKHESCVILDTLRTSKPLMAVTNLPRFVYEGDTLQFSAKVVNTKAWKQNCMAELCIINPLNQSEIATSEQTFVLDSNGQYLFRFAVVVPESASALTFRFVARGEGENMKFSDGEERTIPVLTRRMLVSESVPFFNTQKGSKKFTFNHLPKISSNLVNYRLVFTPQPAWNAVTALPTLMHPEYESMDQLCNQLIGSAMLLQIDRTTSIRNWLHIEVDSARQKEIDARKQLWNDNPWLCRVQTTEDESLQLEALLKTDRLQQNLNQAQRKLVQGQNADGGWPWFKGGNSNTYITRRILIEIGRAKALGWGDDLKISTQKALQWDAKNLKKNYEYLKEKHPELLLGNCLNYNILQYLLARSYYLSGTHYNTEADQFYMQQLSVYAEGLSTWYEQAMAALTLYAVGDTMAAKSLMEGIKRAARHSDELGMYWKDEVRRDFFFAYHVSNIDRQTLMIEAFEKILKDEESVREMKLWLLQQKRGQHWEDSPVTANACMVLLTDYQQVEQSADTINLQIGHASISVVDTLQAPIWRDMLTENVDGKYITLSQPTAGFTYGTLMWQQWQDLDSIVAEDGIRPLSVERKLWRVVTDAQRGDVFQPVTAETVLRPGDRVRVQLVVTADRDMEYVWLKDLHSAAFDARGLASGFRYEGIYHYRTVRDESVNYFFEDFPKGKRTFEYEMYVMQTGTFSDGYAEVKCIFNPEFSNHSAAKGKVKVD